MADGRPGRKAGGTNRRAARCIAAMLWLQGETAPVSTAQVAEVIRICHRETLRVLAQLEGIGCVRRTGRGSRRSDAVWEAADIDDALAAALAACVTPETQLAAT